MDTIYMGLLGIVFRIGGLDETMSSMPDLAIAMLILAALAAIVGAAI
jgi:hypothetical protein